MIATNSSNALRTDKTLNQIVSAFESGKKIILIDEGSITKIGGYVYQVGIGYRLLFTSSTINDLTIYKEQGSFINNNSPNDYFYLIPLDLSGGTV